MNLHWIDDGQTGISRVFPLIMVIDTGAWETPQWSSVLGKVI